MFYVYYLESEIKDECYIGFTKNLRKRLSEHNQGLNSSTKRYTPWKLVYYEACTEESDARRREKYLKTTQGGRMLKLRLKDYRFNKSKSLII
jgi:putative endonuclease